MERLTNIRDNVKNGWTNMSKRKKIIMIALVIIIIAFVSTFAFLANRVNYATLFTNLELDDAGRIADDLEANNIPYKLENGGRDILIDEKEVDSYRIQLAMEDNMPESSSGFELFDNTGLMVTDEDR